MTNYYGNLPITEDENVPVGSAGVVVPDVVTPDPHRLDPARAVIPWFGWIMTVEAIVLAVVFGWWGRDISPGEVVAWSLINAVSFAFLSSLPLLERWSDSLDRRKQEAEDRARERRREEEDRDERNDETEKVSQHYHVTPDLIEPVTALDNGTTPEEEAEISRRSNENNPQWQETLARANTHRGQTSPNEKIWMAINSLRPDVTQEQVDGFLSDLSEEAAEELADIMRGPVSVDVEELPDDIAQIVIEGQEHPERARPRPTRSSRPHVSAPVEPSNQWAVEDEEYDPARAPEQEPPVDTAKDYQDRLVNGQCQSVGPATGDQCYLADGHKGSHRGEEYGSRWTRGVKDIDLEGAYRPHEGNGHISLTGLSLARLDLVMGKLKAEGVLQDSWIDLVVSPSSPDTPASVGFGSSRAFDRRTDEDYYGQGTTLGEAFLNALEIKGEDR